MQLAFLVAGLGQRSGLEQARRLGGRLGPSVPVRAVAATVIADRHSAAAAAATVRPPVRVVAVAVGYGLGQGHHQNDSRVLEVLQEGGQVVRGPVRRAGRRAQRQAQRPVPGRDQDVAAAPLKDSYVLLLCFRRNSYAYPYDITCLNSKRNNINVSCFNNIDCYCVNYYDIIVVYVIILIID